MSVPSTVRAVRKGLSRVLRGALVEGINVHGKSGEGIKGSILNDYF